ncbi:hypothetical protein [Agrilutibacter solisilvae]|uniref:Uncharacterized protein n=1 Tax=Agrilutibacter solisilvae TaxID=2763317 RepID=A0A975ARY7_9GAMM|nr:hypothetical protein [Lysobacter solisilvae]QSX77425.1 hypothetical protein I8J32_011730 [Lysobacter solisilvae]
MNRKLRNTFAAFVASGASLAIALMVAVPATTSPVMDVVTQAAPQAVELHASGAGLDPAAPHLQTLAHAVARSAAAASVLALEARDMEVTPETRTSTPGARHRRQTLVMPYFSFSPRG